MNDHLYPIFIAEVNGKTKAISPDWAVLEVLLKSLIKNDQIIKKVTERETGKDTEFWSLEL